MDVGGTFIKSAVFQNGQLKEELPQVPAQSGGTAEEILQSFRRVFAMAGNPETICVSIPGPFDYRRGISLMTHKFQALKDLKLNEILNKKKMRFIHDANAFLLGEAVYGAGKDLERLGGITLGTGIGAAAIISGNLCVNELGSPAVDVSIWNKPFRNTTVEIHLKEYLANGQKLFAKDLKSISAQARNRDSAAMEFWHEYGHILAEILKPWQEKHKLERVIIGGQIANDFELFAEPLKDVSALKSKLGTNAALFGAAELEWRNI